MLKHVQEMFFKNFLRRFGVGMPHLGYKKATKRCAHFLSNAALAQQNISPSVATART
jgi:hypothetical protein